MPRTKPTKRPAPDKPSAPALSINLPGGGRAVFYAQSELTPRRTRDLDVQLTHLGPRMQELAAAREVTAPDGTTDESEHLPGAPVTISEEEATKFAAVNDLAAWVYLKELRDKNGRRMPLPETVDDVLDLPLPVYRAVVAHAGQLVAASLGDEFSSAALDDVDDLDDADPDLPT